MIRYVMDNLIWRNYILSLLALLLIGAVMVALDATVGIALRYTWWLVAGGWVIYSERWWWRESVFPWRKGTKLDTSYHDRRLAKRLQNPEFLEEFQRARREIDDG